MNLLFSNSELEAYLDETLSADRMSLIEEALHSTPQLAKHLATINSRRDAGQHSLGAIWRRNRLSCPTREQLGSHLLGILTPELADYIAFHLEEIGCRYCHANLADLTSKVATSEAEVTTRTRRYFDSSAGLLRSQND